MPRHVLNADDVVKAIARHREGHDARKMRREAEMWLLNKMLAEAAMPEWYPER